jgi:hypothetical protein
VCGEFITSLDSATIGGLGLERFLQDADKAYSVTWYKESQSRLTQSLPEPALCLSRFALDLRMAEAFTQAGGVLITGQRASATPAEGRVLTSGRRPATRSPWIGLKAHFENLTLSDDLELHLGRHAYVGLSRVENGRVNVCGLFRRSLGAKGKVRKQDMLRTQLKRSGLAYLAERLAEATMDPASVCSVAGLSYHRPETAPNALRLGDRFGLIPPFTGNGMTIALQSARIAVDPLTEWSLGNLDWKAVTETVQTAVERELLPKIQRAQRLHPWLLHPTRQRCLVQIAKRRLLPTRWLYHLLH